MEMIQFHRVVEVVGVLLFIENGVGCWSHHREAYLTGIVSSPKQNPSYPHSHHLSLLFDLRSFLFPALPVAVSQAVDTLVPSHVVILGIAYHHMPCIPNFHP